MCDSQAALIPPPLITEFTPSIGHAAVLETDDDFFQFVGELNLMDIDLPESSLQTSFGESSTPAGGAVHPVASTQRRAPCKASAEDRIQRIREKNRVAQARFRQKQKARAFLPPQQCAMPSSRVHAPDTYEHHTDYCSCPGGWSAPSACV